MRAWWWILWLLVRAGNGSGAGEEMVPHPAREGPELHRLHPAWLSPLDACQPGWGALVHHFQYTQGEGLLASVTRAFDAGR